METILIELLAEAIKIYQDSQEASAEDAAKSKARLSQMLLDLKGEREQLGRQFDEEDAKVDGLLVDVKP